MGSKKIAVKYCGGCNPRYDRTTFIRKLVEKFPELEIELFDRNSEYSAILVVCGCFTQCANKRDLPVGVPQLVVTGESGYGEVATRLSQFCKEGS